VGTSGLRRVIFMHRGGPQNNERNVVNIDDIL